MLEITKIYGRIFYEKNPLFTEVMLEDGKGHRAYATFDKKTKKYVVIYGDSEIFDEVVALNNPLRKTSKKAS